MVDDGEYQHTDRLDQETEEKDCSTADLGNKPHGYQGRHKASSSHADTFLESFRLTSHREEVCAVDQKHQGPGTSQGSHNTPGQEGAPEVRFAEKVEYWHSVCQSLLVVEGLLNRFQFRVDHDWICVFMTKSD